MLRLALAAALVLACAMSTAAHDSWISDGRWRNAAGEWCCGPHDCGELVEDAPEPAPVAREHGWEVHGVVIVEATGARVRVDETVPYAEALPSPDGKFHRCHSIVSGAPGPRRCFFAPPGGF